LAEVLARKQLVQRREEVFDTVLGVHFGGGELALTQPAGHFVGGLAEAGSVVAHQNALHAGTIHEQHEVVGGALHGRRIVVLRDGAADDDAGFQIGGVGGVLGGVALAQHVLLGT
nr:hypothetical protein [Tanacetum cinerariifolium]